MLIFFADSIDLTLVGLIKLDHVDVLAISNSFDAVLLSLLLFLVVDLVVVLQVVLLDLLQLVRVLLKLFILLVLLHIVLIRHLGVATGSDLILSPVLRLIRLLFLLLASSRLKRITF